MHQQRKDETIPSWRCQGEERCCFSSRSPSVTHRLAANSKFGPTRRVPLRSLLVLSSPCTRVVPTVVRKEEDVAREGEMAAENKPEGLKKVRNPDRMYRSAVCYAGHGPPKSISDDTETN
ncbi:hypothetical protein ILYODFUR_006222, partial [Ilyodon furcidens]